LDTNGLSAVAEGEPALESILRHAAQVAIPVIVSGEYRYGIAQSRDDVDERTTISYAAVRLELRKAGTPIPSNDVWIAALCRQHSLPVVSRDRHFDAAPGLRRLH